MRLSELTKDELIRLIDWAGIWRDPDFCMQAREILSDRLHQQTMAVIEGRQAAWDRLDEARSKYETSIARSGSRRAAAKAELNREELEFDRNSRRFFSVTQRQRRNVWQEPVELGILSCSEGRGWRMGVYPRALGELDDPPIDDETSAELMDE